jgi:REP element-mobilizing transposase RayT
VIPLKFSVPKVVRIIKSNISKYLKKKFPFLKDMYWGTDEIWADGCFVSTVGINETINHSAVYRKSRKRRFRASAACSRPRVGMIPWA